MKIFILIFIYLSNFCLAQEKKYELESGLLTTNNMEIHGYNQGNTTLNWKSNEPTARVEYWSVNSSNWNWGIVLQPLYAHYNNKLAFDLNTKGKTFHKGTEGRLDYQFHTVRLSGNYPLLISNHERNYLRLGGTLVARYAKVYFKNTESSFLDSNFLVLPLFNIESEVALFSKYSLFVRADFLPSPTGSVFLDGLFDVLFAFRKHIDDKQIFDVGTRLFFGGYDPNKMDDYANKIFYTAFVLRYSW